MRSWPVTVALHLFYIHSAKGGNGKVFIGVIVSHVSTIVAYFGIIAGVIYFWFAVFAALGECVSAHVVKRFGGMPEHLEEYRVRKKESELDMFGCSALEYIKSRFAYAGYLTILSGFVLLLALSSKSQM